MKKLSLITVMMAVFTIVCFTSVGCTDKKPAPAIDSTAADTTAVSYTHLTLPTNREV